MLVWLQEVLLVCVVTCSRKSMPDVAMGQPGPPAHRAGGEARLCLIRLLAGPCSAAQLPVDLLQEVAEGALRCNCLWRLGPLVGGLLHGRLLAEGADEQIWKLSCMASAC